MTTEIQEAHMSEVMPNSVWDKITTIQNKNALLDSSISAWKNLKSKFSSSIWSGKNKYYSSTLEINKEKKQEVVNFFDNHKIKYSPSLPTAFTEKGLYKLVTILKGEKVEKTNTNTLFRH